MLTHCNANAIIPNFRLLNAAPCKMPPRAAALPPSLPAATVCVHKLNFVPSDRFDFVPIKTCEKLDTGIGQTDRQTELIKQYRALYALHANNR